MTVICGAADTGAGSPLAEMFIGTGVRAGFVAGGVG